ncbi:hypothetical protein BHE74_00022613 [Ensete ventricosum]|nr:hypothetical protein GW17_00021370 [Ensete ventricosum]RWW69757.1 hypothetical protein BHE74_00022613 [Ensete ventricosum]
MKSPMNSVSVEVTGTRSFSIKPSFWKASSSRCRCRLPGSWAVGMARDTNIISRDLRRLVQLGGCRV